MATKTKKAAPPASRKIGGSKFTRVSCHTGKRAAADAAKKIRANGYKARVIGGCVYKGPRAKRKAATA